MEVYEEFMQYAPTAMERQENFLYLYAQLIKCANQIIELSTFQLSDLKEVQYFRTQYDRTCTALDFWGEIVTNKLSPSFASLITSSPDSSSLEYQEMLHVMGSNDYFSKEFVVKQNYHGEIEEIFKKVKQHVFRLLDLPTT